jgi:tetratricopeptide (TPR) repeat protein
VAGLALLAGLLGFRLAEQHNAGNLEVMSHVSPDGSCYPGNYALKWDGGSFAGNASPDLAAVASAAGAPGAVFPLDWNRDAKLLDWLKAVSLIREQKYTESLPHMKSAGSAGMMLAAADDSYGKGDYACALFNRLLAREIGQPEVADRATSWARSLIVNGQAGAVQAAYAEALPYQPDNGDWRLMLANAYLALDKPDDAQAVAQPLFAATPEQQSAINTLFGNYYVGKGRREDALSAYKRADQAKPAPSTASQLAGILLDMQRPKEALPYAQRAAEAPNPLDMALGHQRWGQALQQLHRLDEAERIFRQGMAADPTYTGNAADLAGQLNQEGRQQEAQQILLAAISRATRADFKAAGEYSLGNILTADGQTDQAIVHYKTAAELQPDTAEYTIKAATALQGRGQTQEALALLNAFLQRHPDNQTVLALRTGMMQRK